MNAIERLREFRPDAFHTTGEINRAIYDESLAAVDALYQADREAVELLDGCLNDDGRAWDGEELVALMERVRESLAAAVRQIDGETA